MTTFKHLKLWGGDEDRIFQNEAEPLRIIDAKEIEVFRGKTSKKLKFFDEVEISIFKVFANSS